MKTLNESKLEIASAVKELSIQGQVTDSLVDTLALNLLNHVNIYGDIKAVNDIKLTGSVKGSLTRLIKPFLAETRKLVKNEWSSKKEHKPFTDFASDDVSVALDCNSKSYIHFDNINGLKSFNDYIKERNSSIAKTDREAKATAKAEEERQASVKAEEERQQEIKEGYIQNPVAIIKDAIVYGADNMTNENLDELIELLRRCKS